jgi:hypothetical protein
MARYYSRRPRGATGSNATISALREIVGRSANFERPWNRYS